jgi:hypothetical protein
VRMLTEIRNRTNACIGTSSQSAATRIVHLLLIVETIEFIVLDRHMRKGTGSFPQSVPRNKVDNIASSSTGLHPHFLLRAAKLVQ